MVRSRAKIVLLGGLSSLLVAGCNPSKEKTETLRVAPAPVAHADDSGATISEDDVAREKDIILAGLLPDADKKDYPALLEQFLEKERLSHQEFDMLVRTRAYLRAIAEPIIKNSVTEANIREAFNTRYG